MSNELEQKQNINKLDSLIEKKGGLFDALEQTDKIILLDFSGSMEREYDGKRLYKHLINAVRGYEHEYSMIWFSDDARMIECLEREQTGGGTNLTGALELADSKKATEYIVVSDGLPNSEESALNFVITHNMKISTIFMGDNPRGIKFMKRLANLTGGRADDIKLLKGFGGMLERTVKGLIEG